MVAGGGTMTSAPPPAIGGNGGCTSVSANTSNLAGTTNMPATPQGTNEAGSTRTRTSENRRSNKPIMEKRRRARINNCLNELKTLILDAMKKDPARHSKLEKADILEMTVKHLEALQRQQVAMAAATDPNVANKFRAGFTECAGEVGRFPGLDGPVKRRLLQHLANCLNSTSPSGTAPFTESTTTSTTATNPPLQVHILRTPVQADTPVVQQNNSSNIILANTNGQGVQLVPTRLPNGDIALILPSTNSIRTSRGTASTTPSTSPSPSISSNSSSSSPLPMLIPIPNKTSSDSPSPIALDRLSMNSSSTPSRQITILTTQNAQKILIPQNPKEKNIPLLTTVPYQYNEGSEKIESVVQQRIIIPEPYSRQEKVIKNFDEVPVIHNMQHSIIKARKEETFENIHNYNGSGDRPEIDHRLYERNQIVMTHDGQIIESENPTRYYNEKIYSPERETLLHIPDRDFYESGSQSISPRSPVGYIESMDTEIENKYIDKYIDNKYTGFYSEHIDRSCSPDMQKPLALVTKKKCEDYENEERPWRPW